MKTPMEEKKKRVKAVLGGKLTLWALALSGAAHFSLWGFLGYPRDADGALAVSPPVKGPSRITVTRTVLELPQAPSIEKPTAPRTAPAGLDVKGNFGAVPLPVADGDADVATLSDLNPDVTPHIPPGADLVVVDKDAPGVIPADHPWDTVEFVEYSEGPILVTAVRPKYPDIARDSGIEGDVCLLVYIDERGDVKRATVTASPGLPALEEAAIDAAMRCRFRPARQQGEPVGVWYALVMQFRL